MKTSPSLFAALTVVAVLVTCESTVVFDRMGRAAEAWWAHSPTRAWAVGAAHLAQGLANVLVCGAKL